MWKEIYGLPSSFPADGRQWDRLLAEGETFHVGQLPVTVMLVPGHTLASVTYLIGDTAFIHDTLFMPDVGTARADFPGGSAKELWDSIGRLFRRLPDTTRLYTGHDYTPKARQPAWESTVAQKAKTSICSRLAQRRHTFACASSATANCPCPNRCCTRCRSTSTAADFLDVDASGKRFLRIPLGAFPDAAW